MPEATSTSPTAPRRLVVVVPGFGGRYAWWDSLRARLQDEDGYREAEAKWVPFDHFAGRISGGYLADMAEELVAHISANWLDAGTPDDIVLIGHSMGGLLVRQGYLSAIGAIPGRQTQAWGDRVSRIVLLGSLNRGINLNRVPWHRPLAWFARVVPFLPHFLFEDALRGSDFLTNLRINWIRHFGRTADHVAGAEAPGRRPLVVQVVGTRDSLVSPNDSRDVLAFPDGHEYVVPGADHKSLYRLDRTNNPEIRFAALRQAFTGLLPTRLPQISPARPSAAGRTTAPVRRVVFLLHGIRASNVDAWIRGLEELIIDRDPDGTVVAKPAYGYFTAARFALPTVRRKNAVFFQDLYTEMLARYPDAEFSIIAHSNGTYILGNSLLRIPGMKFEHVVLAGSVLPENFWASFPQAQLAKQVVRMRNERADRDYPVALLCNGLRGLRMSDIGTAGFTGFVNPAPLGDGAPPTEVAYYHGGHGAALAPSNHDQLVEFVFGSAMQQPTDLRTEPRNFRRLSRAMFYLFPALVIGALGAATWFVFPDGGFEWKRATGLLVALILAYILLDIF